MKNARQAMILEIIAREPVETQEQLLRLLRAEGIDSTQATISRDIKQLRLIKEPAGRGAYRYAVSDQRGGWNLAERLRTIFRESIIEINSAQNLVVMKTMPGLASGACSALDSMNPPDMLGSLAGDDTAFIVMKDTQAADVFCRDIREMLENP